jgi:hypothetical protein
VLAELDVVARPSMSRDSERGEAYAFGDSPCGKGNGERR